ncbi:methyltransferase domain-containing protein [Actinocorallia longicatena]|uniref:Methyltransferase domain-containing protein n=1 Tax=Actinocorallia longicatena TaxID=111803 RepID=A0ABP6QH60_9ACTN
MTNAEKYTHGHHDSVLRSHRWRTVENSAAYAARFFVPGRQVLDVGCGPGTISADIAARVAGADENGRPGRVVAIDLAEGVLEEARAHAAEQGVDNITFEARDVYDLPYPDGAFCVVHAHQTLQHVADPVRALKEMRRVCAPGGVVVARDADYAGFTWYPLLPELDEWMDLYQTCARANGGEPDAGRRLLSWARAAGFTDVTPTASVWCHATEDERRYWGEMWRDRVVESQMAEQAVRDGHATEDDLRRLSAAWQRWSDDGDAWFAILHGEIVCRA